MVLVTYMKMTGKFVASIKSIASSAGNFWLSHYSSAFVLALLATTVLGGYIWYQTTYRSAWSGEQKDEYMNSQHRDVTFQEQRFRDMLSIIEKRKNSFESPLERPRGAFLLYD